ncbi:MAG TPA: PIG-L family deacetylase [Roseiarcus sp.]|jgi:N-acetylglucosamine malate deacetylase 2|nr:PIG-L family deacetylase [Roseiarcus sp.]
MPPLNWLADVEAEFVDATRVAVVVAHPDDETIGCGALLARLRNVNIVVVTDGAPKDVANARRAGFAVAADYGRARALELRSALDIAGVPEQQVFAMGVGDGGVWRALVSITQRLAAFFAEHGVEMVLTHAFEGGHSDHDGVAYCVRLAASLLFRRAPTVVEMPYYHHGARGLTFQTFCDGEEEIVARLTKAQVARKRAMFDAFPSQKHILDRLDPSVERFRVAKPCDFRSPPNRGVLRYADRLTDLGLPNWMRGPERSVLPERIAVTPQKSRAA